MAREATYVRLGPDAAEAAKTLRRRELFQANAEAGIKIAESEKYPVRLNDAIEAYLLHTAMFNSLKTVAEFSLVLPQFATSCGRQYLCEVTGSDLLVFAMMLRDQFHLADRTIANRVNRISCFLRHFDIVGLLKPSEKPRYDEPEPQAYDESQLRALFAACEPEEELIFRFFLYSGFREQEVANATYRDVNFFNKTVRVSAKKRTSFRPKNRKERTIPLPDSLIQALIERRKLHQDGIILFPNKRGYVEGHFLRRLKRMAFVAGLNCGECVNRTGLSCSENPVCSTWQLHSFRRSFATLHHEAGVPIRRIQQWLDHQSLEVTLRYISTADHRSEKTREMVNKSFAAI
jgi:integrase/recombinase XerD